MPDSSLPRKFLRDSQLLIQTPLGTFTAQGQIIVEGLTSNTSYDFYLYNSAGKLIRTLTDVVGSFAIVGTLPTGVYHIEIVQRGQIIGDVRVIVK